MINANEKFESETLWCKITTPNSEYYAASIYYPPDPIYEPADLRHRAKLWTGPFFGLFFFFLDHFKEGEHTINTEGGVG